MLDSLRNEVESFNRSLLQGKNGVQDALTLKGLSISEAYNEGILWIALKYRSAQAGPYMGEYMVGLICTDRNVAKPAACFRPTSINELQVVDFHEPLRGDQHFVFISDVESMETVKPESPGFIGLYLVNNDADDFVAWRSSFLFLSVDGTFKRLPVPAEREASKLSERGSVGFASDVISVIEGDAEIVKCIAQDGWGVSRQGASGLRPFQRATLVLGPQSLHVVTDVLPKDGFELVDVMFGPFKL